jgi:hypothetical protein
MTTMFAAGVAAAGRTWWIWEFHVSYLSIHGAALLLAMFVFSHAKNTTYLRLPYVWGWTAEVSRMDTVGFLLFAALSTAASVAMPFCFEYYVAAPRGQTVFPQFLYVTEGPPVDCVRIAVEGSAVLSAGGLLLYAFHRFGCLLSWIKSMTFVGVSVLYFIGVCMLPIFVVALVLELSEAGPTAVAPGWVWTVAMASPVVVLIDLFDELGPQVPRGISTAPLYIAHGVLLGVLLLLMHHRGRKLRQLYLAAPPREAD